MFGTMEPWGYGGYGQVVWIILAIPVVAGRSGGYDQALRDALWYQPTAIHVPLAAMTTTAPMKR